MGKKTDVTGEVKEAQTMDLLKTQDKKREQTNEDNLIQQNTKKIKEFTKSVHNI